MNKKFLASLLPIIFFSLSWKSATAGVEPIETGSYIINMGVMPQTIGNGLKPYGLVYDLVKNYQIPIKWVINSTKTKDGVDFVHNGISYSGGAFIILARYRNPVIDGVIASWNLQGVVGSTSVSDFSAEVVKTINYGPRWTLDKFNGHLAVNYFANAGIPSSAYGGDTSWKEPSELGACDDIFVLPHADPTWERHNNLYYWNINHKGNIWAGCHGASALENLTDPGNTIQMNFLSTHGLVPSALHRRHSTPPFSYTNHTDPMMQFMGIVDGATTNGSERTFLPVLGGSWRPTTSVSVYDTVDTYIPSLSNGPGGIIAYGRGFGDENRGYVMYEAGHSLEDGGTVAEKVAAQRAFFNYSFFVATERYVAFDLSIDGMEPVMTHNVPVNLSIQVPEWVDLSKYSIDWNSSNGGSFDPQGSPSVVFTPGMSSGTVVITVTLTDDCDRAVFSSGMSFVTGVLKNTTVLSGVFDNTDKIAKLEWNGQTDVLYYDVERASGSGYIAVGRVNRSLHTSAYIFQNSPPAGVNYYRLKLVYPGGISRYSNVIAIKANNPDASSVTILSNPSRSVIRVAYTTTIPEQVSISLYDLTGKCISTKAQNLQQGTTVVQIDNTSRIPSGNYIIRVTSSSMRSTQKVNYIP